MKWVSHWSLKKPLQHYPLPATEDTWKHCVYVHLSFVVVLQQIIFFSTFWGADWLRLNTGNTPRSQRSAWSQPATHWVARHSHPFNQLKHIADIIIPLLQDWAAPCHQLQAKGGGATTVDSDRKWINLPDGCKGDVGGAGEVGGANSQVEGGWEG